MHVFNSLQSGLILLAFVLFLAWVIQVGKGNGPWPR